MKISIIIPVYNQEKYLEECLNSIVNQTYSNLEIIIINDGSTDSSYEICKNYAKQDDRIKLFDQSNQGVSVARNKGLKEAKGDYIMFMDPDDYLEYNTFRTLKDSIKDEDIIIFNFYKEFKNKHEKNNKFDIKITDINEIQESILDPNHNPNLKGIGFSWNKLIKKDFLKSKRIKFKMENLKALCEDCIFYYELLEKKPKVKFINKYLYHYRVLNGGATRGYNKDIIEVNKVIYDTVLKAKKKHSKDLEFQNSLNMRMVNNFYLVLDTYILNKKSKLKRKEKKQLIKELISSEEYKNSLEEVVKNKKNKKKLRFYAKLANHKRINLIMISHKLEKLIRK